MRALVQETQEEDEEDLLPAFCISSLVIEETLLFEIFALDNEVSSLSLLVFPAYPS